MTIEEIIKAAGAGKSLAAGAKAIAEAIAEEAGSEIKAETVYKWPKIGIPDRYWPAIIKLTGATPDVLYQANVEARKAVA